jgi:hypothetical protein
MKKKMLMICLLVICQQAFSQKSPKDSLTKLMAADICKEIAANEATLKSSTNWEMDLGLLMLPVYSNYADALEKVMPGFTMDGPGVESLSKEIGTSLGLGCPAFLKLITSNKGKLQELVRDRDNDEEKTLTGVLQKVESNEFTSVHIKMPNGKVEKVWWMEYFNGANSLLEKGRLNKEITIHYKEQDVFNAGLKEYVKTKILVAAVF